MPNQKKKKKNLLVHDRQREDHAGDVVAFEDVLVGLARPGVRGVQVHRAGIGGD